MHLDRITHLFFDLDGTITDPFDGITASVQYALRKYGIEEKKEALKPFIGPPLTQSFSALYGFDSAKALEAVQYYREYYAVQGIYDCTLYEGMESLLREAKKKYRLVLATSKPEPFAVKVLDHFGLCDAFHQITGASMDERRAEKTAVIAKALEDARVDPERVLMIGDRLYDIEGGRENGTHTMAVSYGYGSPGEFVNADVTVSSVEEMRRVLKLS